MNPQNLVGVIGSSGLIGKYVNGYAITSRFESSAAEIRDELKSHGIKTVVHAAGNSNAESYSSFDGQLESDFIEKLLSAMRTFGASRLIYASTAHVYGPHLGGIPVTENHVAMPITTYGKNKLLIEQTAREASIDSGIQLIICRVFSVFSREMKSNFLAGRINEEIKKGLRISRVNNADDIRDFNEPALIGRKLEIVSTIASDVLKENISVVNIASGIGQSVKEKVSNYYKNEIEFEFISGNSPLPYLVADTRRYDSLVNSIRTRYI